MTRRTVAYLCGGMEYVAEQEATSWRLSLAEELRDLGIEVYNPFDFEAGVGTVAELAVLKQTNLPLFQEKLRKIIEIDLRAVERSQLIICRYEGEKVAGTVGELQHAYLLGIPVYLVSSLPVEAIPGWMLGCATQLFKTMGCLLNFLLENEEAPTLLTSTLEYIQP